MKLIKILLTEVFDNPYPLSKPTANFYSNDTTRSYISEFFSKDVKKVNVNIYTLAQMTMNTTLLRGKEAKMDV